LTTLPVKKQTKQNRPQAICQLVQPTYQCNGKYNLTPYQKVHQSKKKSRKTLRRRPLRLVDPVRRRPGFYPIALTYITRSTVQQPHSSSRTTALQTQTGHENKPSSNKLYCKIHALLSSFPRPCLCLENRDPGGSASLDYCAITVLSETAPRRETNGPAFRITTYSDVKFGCETY
jgi:hypothetical protein